MAVEHTWHILERVDNHDEVRRMGQPKLESMYWKAGLTNGSWKYFTWKTTANLEKYSYRQLEGVGTQLVRHVCSSWVVGSDVSVWSSASVDVWWTRSRSLSLSLYSSAVPAGWWHFYVMPTPSEGPWWPVYTAEWCGCILTVLRVIFSMVVSRYLPCGFRLPSCPSPMLCPLTSLSLTSSQLLMQTPCVQFVRRYWVTRTQSQLLGRFVI